MTNTSAMVQPADSSSVDKMLLTPKNKRVYHPKGRKAYRAFQGSRLPSNNSMNRDRTPPGWKRLVGPIPFPKGNTMDPASFTKQKNEEATSDSPTNSSCDNSPSNSTKYKVEIGEPGVDHLARWTCRIDAPKLDAPADAFAMVSSMMHQATAPGQVPQQYLFVPVPIASPSDTPQVTPVMSPMQLQEGQLLQTLIHQGFVTPGMIQTPEMIQAMLGQNGQQQAFSMQQQPQIFMPGAQVHGSQYGGQFAEQQGTWPENWHETGNQQKPEQRRTSKPRQRVEPVVPEQGQKVFVGGLSPQSIASDLWEYFSKYGRVLDAAVLGDGPSKRSRGFGFVEFAGKIPDGVLNKEHVIAKRRCGVRPYNYTAET